MHMVRDIRAGESPTHIIVHEHPKLFSLGIKCGFLNTEVSVVNYSKLTLFLNLDSDSSSMKQQGFGQKSGAVITVKFNRPYIYQYKIIRVIKVRRAN